MNKSESLAALAKALSIVQGKLQPAIKDAKNPFFKSNYSSLNSVWDSCRALLAENGLAVTQVNQIAENAVIIETVLLHESGEWLSGEMYLPLNKSDAQSVGSATSYGRRYGLAAIIGIVTDDDDDGQAASQPKQNAPRPQNNPPAQTNAEKPIRDRIRAAEKAINTLGGKDAPVDFTGKSDAELVEELKVLNEQYTRLKQSGGK